MGIRSGAWFVGALLLGLLAGCKNTFHDEPELQGYIGQVKSGDDTRLWVLHKQREVRTVGVGGRGRNSTAYWRKDTYFHFEVQAFDPATARPAWLQRVASFSDPELQPMQRKPSRVVGSSMTGRLLGQDGDLVWLLVGNQAYALDAANGEVVHDAGAIEKRHPQLAGLLPSEDRLLGFDQGLVVTLADARRVRLRGRGLELEDYVPRPSTAAAPELKPNGMPRIVPTRPMVPMVRHVPRGEDEWLALFTDKEAADAANDGFGDHARYPYSIDDEGLLARRSFWRVRLAPMQRFEETYLHIAAVEPVPESPALLRGRFVRDPATDAALDPGDGDLLVWHRTRIDDAGRLALSRLGADLGTRWQVELPLTDGGTDLPVLTWRIGGHLLAQGYRQDTRDEVRSRVPHLVSVRLDDGSLSAWNLAAGAPPGEPPRFPRDE